MLKDELHLIVNLPMERVFLLLEEGDFYRADNYCDQILDQDPRLAHAYVGKLLAELQIRSLEDLLTTNIPFTTSNNYQNALKFSQDPLKSFLSTAPYENFYIRANKIMQNARSEKDYQKATDIFKKILNYKDSGTLCQKCSSCALICKNNAVYEQAATLLEKNNVSDCKESLRLFQSIPGWIDSNKQAEFAQKKIDKLIRQNQKTTRVIIFTCSVIAGIIGAYFLITRFVIPNSHYNNAVKLMNSGDYESAVTSFTALGKYRDSPEKITECQNLIKDRQYDIAKQTMANGSYDAAIVMFQDLNGYRDSELMIDSCRAAINDSMYRSALALMDSGKYEEAISLFDKLNGYLDSTNMIADCRKGIQYYAALSFINSKKYIDAYVILSELGDFKDCKTVRNSIWSDYKTSIKQADIGSVLVWGVYEQDNNIANGKEPIEWYVINKTNNRILLISKYILDRKKFDDRYLYLNETFWETCSLRIWLNNDFYNNSFNNEEQTMIPSITVDVHVSPDNPRESFGNVTTDKVFLLSTQGVDQYLTNETIRTEGTKFANKSEQYENWWLRNNAGSEWTIHFVNYGDIFFSFPNDSGIGVRPVIWINTN